MKKEMESDISKAEEKATINRAAYVYIVACEDGSLYTGITTDIKRRMKEHAEKQKNGAKYTRSRTVKTICMVWLAESYSSAARLEYAIKKLKRTDKLQLIEHPSDVTNVYITKLSGQRYIVKKEYCMPVSELV